MRSYLTLLCLITLPVLAIGQASTPAAEPAAGHNNKTSTPSTEDLRPNNPAVPDAYAIDTQFERIVVMRFKYQTDIQEGMERLAKEQHIRHGIILSAVGSVSSYTVNSIVNSSFPTKSVKQVSGEGQGAEILAMNGIISNGKVNAHIDLSDGQKAFGGHIHPGTRALSFVIVTVGVLKDDLDIPHAVDRTYR
jgi:predicted DNA-binding protein with PD1-like motif